MSTTIDFGLMAILTDKSLFKVCLRVYALLVRVCPIYHSFQICLLRCLLTFGLNYVII